ncbi:hypothetical protein [Lentzea sp. NBRC 102530]|uniref:hypothetical protein n=1 Tax=Lentzea sp. NBRC 102530 TaxID=3032201 RepID=UPI0024A0A4D7|nr:hypothetical protein [Lentzea sp. NBRC 102530]GLY50244.1 hypothetical protein Lesp01_39000 [Lentzea sp. NBRC 102530]
MTTDEVGTLTDHSAALGPLKTQKAQIQYALEHMPRGCTVDDVRRWLSRQGQKVPTRPYATPIVNEWRARNGVTDTAGQVVLTPELIAQLDQQPSPEPEPEPEPEPAPAPEPGPAKPAGAKGFYLVALMSIGVSVDTSWRFFEQRLGITDVVERVLLFSVMEAALIACGWAMRGGVRQNGRPGPARLVAWALTAFAAFAAFSLSGPIAGAARVLLGPVLGLVMLHLALGIEIRAARRRTTTWTRIGREVRERFLSLLGLGDDGRDALARTRDKAALRAAKLALAGKGTPWRKARLRKALHASNVAHDPRQKDKMLRELGVLQHADKLARTNQPAPW